MYAAIFYGFLDGAHAEYVWRTIFTLLICAVSLYGMAKYKWHPIKAIILAGAAGIVLF